MAIYHTLQLRVSEYEWNKFQELKGKGFTARDVIEIITCTPCAGMEIIVFDKENKPITIKRNILRNKRKSPYIKKAPTQE